MPQYLKPAWPVPSNIKAFSTFRTGGMSDKPYDSFNLGRFVGDDQKAVQANRDLLKKELQLPSEPLWIKQVHGVNVVEYKDHYEDKIIEADASISFQPNHVCIVLTADCLPVLISDKKGTQVAAVHAGWRGLAAGVIEATIKKLNTDPEGLLIWLGPAIGSESFEVGEDVLNAFGVKLNSLNLNYENNNNNNDPVNHRSFNLKKLEEQGFKLTNHNKFLANIYQLAKLQLKKLGILESSIFGGEYCTYKEEDKFFSFRRDKETGRMASLIWFGKEYNNRDY